MRKFPLMPSVTLAAALVAAGAFVAPGFAQPSATAPAAAAAAARPVLDIAQVHARLEAAGYRDIVEIERERDRYEVKALDAEGRRVELDVDASTAEVRKTEVKGSARAPRPDASAAATPAPLTLAQVHERVAAAGYRSIEKIERERDRVEVRALDAEGRRVELDVDPLTAQVRKVETKSERRRTP
ncbi:PepSY domain-containing protein [Azohydromonas sp.]|uniref:PepSY domain-containing protein n=1 Tax=Azohydromonas sp. TaxID=1872666 RepID=UPI002BB2678A|nr:PepSY domain-containing protein [Azohydromonas sp.]HMM86493.1 PepSY domain-containing protein [Azohydromonas sp.]